MSTAKYRAEHREHARQKSAEWRANHPDRAAASRRKYRETHADAIRVREATRVEQKHRYYVANRDRINLRNRAWQIANVERCHDYEHAARARKTGNGGRHTAEQWLAKCAEFGNRCAYCGAEKSLERDHIVPLSRGGTNDINNIIPACRSCNARKHAKTADEFRAMRVAS